MRGDGCMINPWLLSDCAVRLCGDVVFQKLSTVMKILDCASVDQRHVEEGVKGMMRDREMNG
jgi:hypothetical protein